MIKARIPASSPGTSNLKNYEEVRRAFSWERVEPAFSWHPDGKMNIIAESVDKWAEDPERSDHPALIFEARGKCLTYTYARLRDISCQWAAMLNQQGFLPGDRLLVFLPNCPEVYFALIACARLGIIFCPVFDSCNFYEIDYRVNAISPRAVLTCCDLVEKISPESSGILEHILLIDGPVPGIYSNEKIIGDLPEQAGKETACRLFSRDTPLYMMFTSGSTRPPKAIVHSHGDMVGIYTTTRWVLDVKSDTILWTDAEPAWVTGTVYGAYGPWLCGITSLVVGDGFSAANWYRALERHGVTTWYTTPRILRDLMDSGEDLPTRYDLSRLRHIAAVGAPLIPDILYWCREHLKCTPHDTWWMTETGIICLANLPGQDIKPGSMGKPLPGIGVAVLDESGKPLPPLSFGELALEIPWPGMLNSIWQDENRYSNFFLEDRWFLTGDIAVEDEDGYFYHQGRNDDLLKAGDNKLVGPFEIEQILCMHPAVREAAVICKGSEPGSGISYLKAFVTIAQGYEPSTRLTYELKAFLKGNLDSDMIVGEIAILDELPKTRSGKLLRRLLRARELGLPGGDPRKMRE